MNKTAMNEVTLEEVNQTLVAARLLLSDPDSWTKGYFGLNKSGLPVSAADHRACRFCSQGALTAIVGKTIDPRKTAALKALNTVVPMLRADLRSVVGFNDAGATTHEEVLELFDLAIALTEPTT